MDPSTLELAEPNLRGWLSTIGLDTEYVRAAGNTLYRRDEAGAEVPVLDLVGGYGSLMFGHNHPDLVAYATGLLSGGTPIHAQFSRHPYANDVARMLNAIIRRETGTDDVFNAIFANSGAEAIEAAMKHAELDRTTGLAALMADIDARLAVARAATTAGTVTATDAAALGGLIEGAAGDPQAVLAAVERHNAAQAGRAPVFLALEGSFHGKLAGSVQLTHNPMYRGPFARLAAQARFVPAGQPDTIRKIMDEESGDLYDVTVEGDVLRVLTRPAPVFAGFLLEPIQGEGGIQPVPADTAREIRAACAAYGCPIIIDEIQSGLGRTGTFLASKPLGIVGDYYTFGKSLGGGLAKAAVMLVRHSRYQPTFEFVHSSTFAKDSFSCLIAARVLAMLEADDGRAYRTADERGQYLKAALEAVRADFPDVIADVRGRGLMLGLEFRDQSGSAVAQIGEHARAGVLGYVISGYLLREHGIRVFPTASNTNTLRFEPSIHLSDAEVDHLTAALRALGQVLRDQDGDRLLPAA